MSPADKPYDLIIIGGGVAALSAACTLPESMRVLILTKAADEGCNSYWAQGGIAAARDEADIPGHIEDTLAAGAGLCDRTAVERLVREGYQQVRALIEAGMGFDRDQNGQLLYTREAAHGTQRILHAGGDATGRELLRFLAAKNPHPIQTGTTAVDLLIDRGRCYGVSVQTDQGLKNLYAKATLIASGGFGGLYAISTNAPGMLGQMQGVAAHHGLMLKDMHLTQFHPTVFTGTDAPQKPLLSEALRGEGAYIVDENDTRFVCTAHEAGELAPRDIVARSIYAHLQKGHEVYLDMRHFDAKAFKTRFPTIHKSLAAQGYDLPAQKVPIAPAFHYAMGGIATDLEGRVPGMAGLYAAGEVACTGVHGANRLASNSLLEALVFGRLAALAIAKEPAEAIAFYDFDRPAIPLSLPGDGEILAKIRTILWRYAGISRTHSGLKEGLEQIEILMDLPKGWLLALSLESAAAIFKDALASEKSVGAHHLEETNSKG
jgi:L-aspartate oxidase